MAEDEEGEGKGESAKLFIRDVVIAVVIVVLIIGGIFAYTQTWPPMVVVESNSMQHSDTESFLGVIDTGDLVLVQSTAGGDDIVTFLEGRHTGHETYSDYGDVIIYNEIEPRVRGRIRQGTPIIHRAIVYLEWNAALGGYDIPALALSGNDGLWRCVNGSCNESDGPFGLRGEVIIDGMSVSHDESLKLNLGALANRTSQWSLDGEPYSGYITLGDNNEINVDTTNGMPRVTPPEAVVGKARGEIPWFGLIKLTLIPTSNCCDRWGCVGVGGNCHATRNSWDALVVSLVVLISIPVVVDILLAYREKRKKDREAPGEMDSDGADAEEDLEEDLAPDEDEPERPDQ